MMRELRVGDGLCAAETCCLIGLLCARVLPKTYLAVVDACRKRRRCDGNHCLGIGDYQRVLRIISHQWL